MTDVDHTDTGRPTLANWTVRYDPIFNMPESIDGTIVSSNGSSLKKGSRVQIDAVLLLDLENHIVMAGDKKNTTFNLFGPGRRLVAIFEDEFYDPSDDLDFEA